MSDGAIRHASPHPPVERSEKCGGCRLQRELDDLRVAVPKLTAQRNAWKTLHDAKGHGGAYAYASQAQLREIDKAQKVVDGTY